MNNILSLLITYYLLKMKNYKFKWENYWKSLNAFDLYNIMLWIIEKKEKHPERLTMCHVLLDKWQAELLYSLLVNAWNKLLN